MAKYNITSESQLIDITTINNGCKQIELAAERFEECAKKVYDASDICTDKALSVDKTTMQPQLDADAQYIQSIKKAIYDFTMQIKNVAVQIYSEQETELSNYKATQAANSNQNNGNTTP